MFFGSCESATVHYQSSTFELGEAFSAQTYKQGMYVHNYYVYISTYVRM